MKYIPNKKFVSSEKRKIVYKKWEIFIILNKSLRYYLGTLCRISDKDLINVYNEEEIKNEIKEIDFQFEELYFVAMRWELLSNDGVMYREDAKFIRKCAKILEIDNQNFIENVIAFAAGDLTAEDIEETEENETS
jgi:hypothetical protein